MKAKIILVVDDEYAVREMLRYLLEKAEFRVQEAGNAREVRNQIDQKRPDMILLDWMLPGTSGLELARQLKQDPLMRHIPIIMLTAKVEEDDRVRGLENGADDYVTKPFSGRELIARIKAVWRRGAPEADDGVIEVRGLRVDPLSYRVTACGETIDLGLTEFRLLHFLATHPERVYSRGQLLDCVWHNGVNVEDRTVDVYIRRLRKALAQQGHDNFLQTVRGAGYRFSTRV